LGDLLILISNHFLLDFDFESTYFCQNQNHTEINYYLLLFSRKSVQYWK